MMRPMTAIVDAHHHFWDPADDPYPWMTGPLEAIRRPFGADDLRPLLEATGVSATVLVQTRSSLDESRAFLATAEAVDFVAGVVGWVDLTVPGVADSMAGLRAGPGGDALVGIRHQVHDEPDPRWLARDDVRRGLRAVEDAGLVYDLLVRPRELPAALDVARAMPGLRFVVDHIAKPPITTGELEPWSRSMEGFGELSNVACKVSGMVTEADWKAWRIDDLSPFVDHVLNVFGPERLLFGSDWPVCLVAASYQTVLDTTVALLGRLSAVEREAVMGGTAVRIYGLRIDGDS
jgi:L-fuconolactonase